MYGKAGWGRGNDGWMMDGWKRMVDFCGIRPFQQYICHFRTYRESIWGCLCGISVGSLSLFR